MKLIKLGFLLVFLTFMKRISSLGKKIRVKISQEKPLAFEAESEFQNTKLLELKKTERDRYTAKAKTELENEKNKEKEEEKKAAINSNLNIGILNKRCNEKDDSKVPAKPASNMRNEGNQIQEKAKEEEKIEKQKITFTEPKERENKDLGFSIETKKEFLKEETKPNSAILYKNSEIPSTSTKAPPETSNRTAPAPIKNISEQTKKQNENFLSPTPTPSNKPEANVQPASSSATPVNINVNPIANVKPAPQTTPNPLSRYTNIAFGLNGPMSFDNPGLAAADDSHFDKLQEIRKNPLNQAAWPTPTSSFLSDIAL